MAMYIAYFYLFEKPFQLADLRKCVAEIAMKEPYMSEDIPVRWLQFEKAVLVKVAEGIKYMQFEKVTWDIFTWYQINPSQKISPHLNISL